jgi:hypothetical protein
MDICDATNMINGSTFGVESGQRRLVIGWIHEFALHYYNSTSYQFISVIS